MSDLMFCTEAEVKVILLQIATDSGEEAPNVFVAYRQQSKNQLSRLVTFVIPTKEGNETLVNAIIKSGASDYENELRFVKSDVNVQDNLTIDYLMVEALIHPQLAL